MNFGLVSQGQFRQNVTTVRNSALFTLTAIMTVILKGQDKVILGLIVLTMENRMHALSI